MEAKSMPLLRSWHCTECRDKWVTRAPHDIPVVHEGCGGVILRDPLSFLERHTTFDCTIT